MSRTESSILKDVSMCRKAEDECLQAARKWQRKLTLLWVELALRQAKAKTPAEVEAVLSQLGKEA